MADLMLQDLETDQELDHKALADLIGGKYRYRGCGKKRFRHYCAHHWHSHHHGRGGYGRWRKYYKRAWNYYQKNYC